MEISSLGRTLRGEIVVEIDAHAPLLTDILANSTCISYGVGSLAVVMVVHKYTNIQIYQYTNIQIYKYTNIQIYIYTNIQIYKYTNANLLGGELGW